MVTTSSALNYTPETPVEQEEDLPQNTTATFDIVSMTEHDDGSLSMLVDMDYDTIVKFAKIGILKTLEEAANKVLGEVNEG